MAHLDVVPVDESAPWQHPPFCGRDRRRRRLGPRHARRQGLRRRDLRGGRAAARGRAPARPRTSGCPSAATRRSPARRAEAAVDELRTPRRARRGSSLDEGGAIAHGAFPGVKRAVGGRSASPRRAPPASSSGSTGRGGHASTPARNGPTARLARADPPARPQRRCRPALPDATVELMRTPGAARCRGRCGRVLGRADRIRPLLTRALLRRRPRGRGDGADDVRGHHARRLARRST